MSATSLRERIHSCRVCPRLVTHREEVARVKRRAYREETYWGRPLTGFGDPLARLCLVGLAPAAHGGNRTGRVFTGDRSGDFLTAALHRAGYANQPLSRHREDGLQLYDAFMSMAVRCAPPANKPTPEETRTCRPFLREELAVLPRLRVVLALGKFAWDAYLAVLREDRRLVGQIPGFAHGTVWQPEGDLPVLVGSYHPSQQNTQTGRLTAAMMDAVFSRIREEMGT